MVNEAPDPCDIQASLVAFIVILAVPDKVIAPFALLYSVPETVEVTPEETVKLPEPYTSKPPNVKSLFNETDAEALILKIAPERSPVPDIVLVAPVILT